MIKQGQDGYVLAGALAILFAVSLAAAALVSSSVDNLFRVKAAEKEAAERVTLQSALLLVGSQLSQDPMHRALDLREGAALVSIGNYRVNVSLAWEADRLDVNRASVEHIEQMLQEKTVIAAVRDDILSAVRALRARSGAATLLDDLRLGATSDACANELLTPFGGRTEFKPGEAASPGIGRPGAGARLRVDLRLLNDDATREAEAVILLTGNAKQPFHVLDWRPHTHINGDPCHAS